MSKPAGATEYLRNGVGSTVRTRRSGTRSRHTDGIAIGGRTMSMDQITDLVMADEVDPQGRRMLTDGIRIPDALRISTLREINGWLERLDRPRIENRTWRQHRYAYLAATALAEAAYPKAPIWYITVAPPHIERENRVQFWDAVDKRMRRALTEIAGLVGGAHWINLWEVSAKIDSIHPHRNILLFPTAAEPRWDLVEGRVDELIRQAINEAMIQATGVDRYVAREAVFQKALNNADVSYFFKKFDPHSAEDPTWAWGNLVEIAADADVPEDVSTHALAQYDEILELTEGRRAYSMSARLRALRGHLELARKNAVREPVMDASEDPEDYLTESVMNTTDPRNEIEVPFYDEYQESESAESENPVRLVLRRPLAWWLRRHREKLIAAYVERAPIPTVALDEARSAKGIASMSRSKDPGYAAAMAGPPFPEDPNWPSQAMIDEPVGGEFPYVMDEESPEYGEEDLWSGEGPDDADGLRRPRVGGDPIAELVAVMNEQVRALRRSNQRLRRSLDLNERMLKQHDRVIAQVEEIALGGTIRRGPRKR